MRKVSDLRVASHEVGFIAVSPFDKPVILDLFPGVFVLNRKSPSFEREFLDHALHPELSGCRTFVRCVGQPCGIDFFQVLHPLEDQAVHLAMVV